MYGVGALTLPVFITIVLQPALVAPEPGKPWGTPNPLVDGSATVGLIIGIDNIIVDFLIAYIPIPLIKGLNISHRKKQAIIILFALGFMLVQVLD